MLRASECLHQILGAPQMWDKVYRPPEVLRTPVVWKAQSHDEKGEAWAVGGYSRASISQLHVHLLKKEIKRSFVLLPWEKVSPV